MNIPLWQEHEEELDFVVRVSTEGKIVVPLWVDTEEKKQRELQAKREELTSRKEELLSEKVRLAGRQEEVARLKSELDQLTASNASGSEAGLQGELAKLLRHDLVQQNLDSQPAAASLFFFYRASGLQDKMAEVVDRALEGVVFEEQHYPLWYAAAVHYQEYGDPSKAKAIFQRFVEAMRLDYEDVADRYKRLTDV